MTSVSGIFTIPASAPFARDAGARIDRRALGSGPLALSDVTIYLPTRRAARTFGEAFARVLGGAALLPQFRALGDGDEDDLLFDAAGEGLELPPAIAPIRRQLLLAALIRHWEQGARRGRMSFAQAAALADSLAGVMDEVETPGRRSCAGSNDLAPLALAEHWEDVTRFLDLDPRSNGRRCWRRKARSIRRRGATWRWRCWRSGWRARRRPGMVIAAGSTGSIPATARTAGA